MISLRFKFALKFYRQFIPDERARTGLHARAAQDVFVSSGSSRIT